MSAFETILDIPIPTLNTLRSEMFASDSSNECELIGYLLCRRGVTSGQLVYHPSLIFVPKGEDYVRRDEESVVVRAEAVAKVHRRIRHRPLHLAMVHTHSTEGWTDFSGVDSDGDKDLSDTLRQFPGQPILIAGVFDHLLSARFGKFRTYRNGVWYEVKVRYSETVAKPGRDFTEVGVEVGGIHVCPSPNFGQSLVPPPSHILQHEWRARLLPTRPNDNLVWEDESPNQINLQIRWWPLECRCRLAQKPGNIVQLSQLGYHKQPWRGD